MSFSVTLKQKQIARLEKKEMTYARREQIIALHEGILRKVGKGKDSLPYFADYVVFLDKNHYFKATMNEADGLLRRAQEYKEPYYAALAHRCLGTSAPFSVKKAETETYLNAARDEFTALCDAEPSERNRRGLAETLAALGDRLHRAKRDGEAVEYLKKAAPLYEELGKEYGGKYHFAYLRCLHDYACTFEDHEKAIPVLESCLPVAEELLAQKGLSEAEIETVYLILYPLAYRYLKTEQYEKGQAVAEKAVLAGKRMVQKSEFRCKQTSWALAVAADCYGYAGQVERAKALAEEAKTYKLRYKKFMDFHPEKDPYGKGDSKYYNNVLGNMDADPETYTMIL